MLKTIVDLYASLILAPVVLLGFGDAWTQYRSFEAQEARLLTVRGSGPQEAEAVRLAAVEESASIEAGTRLGRGQLLEVALPRPLRSFSVTLQASVGHAFRIAVSEHGERYRDFWVAPGLRVEGDRELRDKGLMSRTSPRLVESTPVRFLRIVPGPGRGTPAVASVRIEEQVLRIPHWLPIPLLWGTWLALFSLGLRGALRAWGRADAVLAGVLVGLASFDFVGQPLAACAWSGGLIAAAFCLRAVARLPSPEVALSATLSVVVAVAVAPLLWRGVALSEVAALHDLSVDHRSTPDGDEINSDGARYRGEAADLRDEDFVVLFLGDSFTYGYGLDYEHTYPAVVERSLAADGCSVKLVNFGWLSSSPLLSFRLLREVGASYRPDLVVYNLDMTDFHDDLRYERELREQGERVFGAGDVLWAGLVSAAPPIERAAAWLAERAPLRAAERNGALPRDRFFATSRPLEHSRDLIERGVMRNLARIHRFTRDELSARMALVVLPRAYQHSREEAPRNWERSRYEVLGPHVREPFRYFEEVAGELEHPVFELLSEFEASSRFPLYFENDPHWNRDGARLAGEAVARKLRDAGLVPCSPSGP